MRSPKCHPEKKYGARDMCRVCYNSWLRKNNEEYDRKCKESTAKYGKTDKARNYRANLNMLSRYGITTEQKQEMKIKQSNRCKICDKEKVLVVEHNHSSGKVRGLVCHRCNILIGQLENNLNILPSAFMYLTKFGFKII